VRAGAAVALTLAATAWWSAAYLRLESATPVMLVALLVVPSFISPVARGALQGATRFRALGWSLLAYVALRLALGAGLVLAGVGLSGAVLGILLAEVAGVVAVLLPLRRTIAAARPEPAGHVGLLREGVGGSMALLAFWILATVDVVLARHYLPPQEAGRYAAAALVGKAVLFAATGVAMVAYPRFAEERGDARRILRFSAALVVATGAGASATVALFPDLLPLVLGEAYRSLGAPAPLLALAMGAFGVASLLTHHRLASGRAGAAPLWLAIPVEIGALALFHDSPAMVAAVVLATACLVAAAMWRGIPSRFPRSLPDAELWDAPGQLELSVITPTYNDEGALAPILRELVRVLDGAGIRHEVIVVSDGSTDGTVEEARRLVGPGVRVLHYARNRGKGYALRTGLARASGGYVAFIDSDGDLDPSDLVGFLNLMRMYDADMVVGSKRHPLSEVSYPLSRRVMSWGYHVLVRLLFGIRATDTQTGIKLIRRELLAEVLPRLVEKRFAFDLELMVAARRAGYRRVLEAPIRLRYRFTSSISRRAVGGMVKDTLAIWYRRFVVRQYDPAREERVATRGPVGAAAPEPPVGTVGRTAEPALVGE
ncbi:MAG: glycosyltransferase, partial [Actinomycetota bacterium]|nr:glycosyltransferase [Actinomycetota bacterium]